MDELKQWLCKNGHVMGQVVRDGSHVRRLLLYRRAVVAMTQDRVEVMAIVEGQTDVYCSICGEIRTWVMGQEAMDRLIEAARKNRGGGR